jgi:DNA-binding HxlR family transcriptional regulator
MSRNKPHNNDGHDSRSVDKAMKLFADSWTLCAVMHLEKGEQRFCGLQREMGDVNPVTLTNRLRKLEDEGIVKRKEETLDKVSVSYELTAKGKDLLPVIKALGAFAKKFYS